MTLAPLLIVTPLPIVMDVLSLHWQAVPELNVTFVRTTGLSEHSGHGDSGIVVVVVLVVGVVVVADVDVVVVEVVVVIADVDVVVIEVVVVVVGVGESEFTAAPKFTLGLVMPTFPSVMESPVSTSFDFTEAGVRKDPLRLLLAL